MSKFGRTFKKENRENWFFGICLALGIALTVAFVYVASKPAHYEYNGHQYIRFYHSTVHDPDCPCGHHELENAK